MRKLLFLLALCTRLAAIDMFTEAKVGYFIPTDSKFRTIYTKNAGIWGFETSARAYRNFFPWASISYFEHKGHTEIGGRFPSKLYFIPIGAGLKYIYSFDSLCGFEHLNVYGGLGALPTYLHIRNESPSLLHKQDKWGCGGIIKVGVIADRLWNFFVDFFAEYSFLSIPFHKQPVEMSPAILSHFSIGGGIGYHFGGRSIECDDD